MVRLRSKLSQYYETEGAADTVPVDVPKGRYIVSFERRIFPAGAPLLTPSGTVRSPVPEPHRPARLGTPLFVAGAVLAAILLLVYLAVRPSPNVKFHDQWAIPWQ
jgi:hypothetical protein